MPQSISSFPEPAKVETHTADAGVNHKSPVLQRIEDALKTVLEVVSGTKYGEESAPTFKLWSHIDDISPRPYYSLHENCVRRPVCYTSSLIIGTVQEHGKYLVSVDITCVHGSDVCVSAECTYVPTCVWKTTDVTKEGLTAFFQSMVFEKRQKLGVCAPETTLPAPPLQWCADAGAFQSFVFK